MSLLPTGATFRPDPQSALHTILHSLLSCLLDQCQYSATVHLRKQRLKTTEFHRPGSHRPPDWNVHPSNGLTSVETNVKPLRFQGLAARVTFTKINGLCFVKGICLQPDHGEHPGALPGLGSRARHQLNFPVTEEILASFCL